MSLSLLSQPAQAIIVWNFSYNTNNGVGNDISFIGTLTSNGDSFLANNIYSLEGISGTVTDGGNTSSVSQLYLVGDNKFVWDGTTAISLTSLGISFSSAAGNNYQLYSVFGASNPGEILAHFNGSGLYASSTSFRGGEVTSSSLAPTAVPWETDALPLVVSTIFFGAGVWAKNKFAKPLQK